MPPVEVQAPPKSHHFPSVFVSCLLWLLRETQVYSQQTYERLAHNLDKTDNDSLKGRNDVVISTLRGRNDVVISTLKGRNDVVISTLRGRQDNNSTPYTYCNKTKYLIPEL